MRIQVLFQFIKESHPSAFTGVEDGATDLLLPAKGDLVTHTDVSGRSFSGIVAERKFSYDIPEGINVDGVITVTLFLNRPRAH